MSKLLYGAVQSAIQGHAFWLIFSMVLPQTAAKKGSAYASDAPLRRAAHRLHHEVRVYTGVLNGGIDGDGPDSTDAGSFIHANASDWCP